jgi:hypothetical protein
MTRTRRSFWLWLWDGPYRSFWAVSSAATFAWLQAALVVAEVQAGMGGGGWGGMGWFIVRFLAAALVNLIAGLIWPVSWICEMGPGLGGGAVVLAFVVWVAGRARIGVLERS